MKTLNYSLSQEMVSHLLSGAQIVWYINGSHPCVLLKLAKSDEDGFYYYQYDAMPESNTYYLAVRRNGRLDVVITQVKRDNQESRIAKIKT